MYVLDKNTHHLVHSYMPDDRPPPSDCKLRTEAVFTTDSSMLGPLLGI